MIPPLVAIVIPTYNSRAYLGDALRSALAQDYPRLEVILVDDGSTDGSEALYEPFLRKDRRLRVVRHKKNRGCSAALNSGIETTDARYICWLSSDDRHLVRKTSLQISLFEHLGSDVAAVYTDYRTISSSGDKKKHFYCKPVPDEWMLSAIIINNFINGSTVMLRRSAWEFIGGFDETLQADTDGDMWMRLLAAGYRFRHLDRTTTEYRRHGDQMSYDLGVMQRDTDLSRRRIIDEVDRKHLLGGLSHLHPWHACQLIAKSLRNRGREEAAKAIERKGLLP